MLGLGGGQRHEEGRRHRRALRLCREEQILFELDVHPRIRQWKQALRHIPGSALPRAPGLHPPRQRRGKRLELRRRLRDDEGQRAGQAPRGRRRRAQGRDREDHRVQRDYLRLPPQYRQGPDPADVQQDDQGHVGQPQIPLPYRHGMQSERRRLRRTLAGKLQ